MFDSGKGSERLLSKLTLFGIRLGLDSVRKLLARLGDPHLATPTILIAGTNGKGSTAALLASMAAASGYRTGLYTSPHLEQVEERIRLDGSAIGEGELFALLKTILDASRDAGFHPPTYFEALTVAAWLFFAESGADIAILEVGLGGRLDATNASHPILSLVTEISLDHQQHLGTTLSAIAKEKAGVFRSDQPALAWTESKEARTQLEVSARAIGAPLELVDATTTVVEQSFPGGSLLDGDGALGIPAQQLRVATPQTSYDLALPLAGRHQWGNLALALRAAETLKVRGWEGFDSLTIAQGVASCRWPGRLELLSLPNGQRVILDAAHNPNGAQQLASFLRDLDGDITLMFGVVDDKDVVGILGPLLPHAQKVILTTAVSHRALPPQTVAKTVEFGEKGPLVEPRLDAALEIGLAEPSSSLVVCGSIFLVGPTRASLRRRFGVPSAAASMRLGAAPPAEVDGTTDTV